MKTAFSALLMLVISSIAAITRAGEGLDIPEALDRKVPLEGLTGISRFFATTYNDNLILYAVYCTVIMAVVGVAIAFLADIVLKAMGMEVHKIEHKE